MKAVLLNGPPRAGKDTIGAILAQSLPRAACTKFAYPIVQFMIREFNIDPEQPGKDMPHRLLLGRTPREVMIAYSEKFCLPLWGNDFFGQSALARMKNGEDDLVWVFTDSGFAREAIPLLDEFGSDGILQVQIHRVGHTFQGDSRSYWEHPRIGCIEFDNNAATLTDLQDKVRADLVPELLKWINR